MQSRIILFPAMFSSWFKLQDMYFLLTLHLQENELALINERLSQARHIMDRLRACVVASYYAKSFTKSGAKGPGAGASQHPAIQVRSDLVTNETVVEPFVFGTDHFGALHRSQDYTNIYIILYLVFFPQVLN